MPQHQVVVQIVDSLEMASVKFLNAVTERQLKPAGA